MKVLGRVSIALVTATMFACGGSPTSPTPPVTTPPSTNPPALTITCPTASPGTTVEGSQVAVSFGSAVATGGVPPVQVACTRESGSLFGAGTTQVQCTATDSAGQSVACVFNVVVTARPPRLSKTRFLAFGDSMTAGEISVPTSGASGHNFRLIVVPTAAYPTRLASMLRGRYSTQASAIDVANSGYPGEWAQDGVYRLPPLVAGVRPEVVLLLEGINDIGVQGDLGVFRAGGALNAMAQEARNRGARVLLATLPPSRPGGTHSVATRLITDLNDQIRQIAAGEGAVLVDLYAGMSGDVSRYIGLDGLHPTEAGYERMAELFYEAIRTTLEER